MTDSVSAPSAIVTGSSRGIGRAIAIELAQSGFSIVVNYLRNRERGEQVVEAIERAGGTAIAVSADVGAAEGRAALVDSAVRQFGRLDILVNNAGITSPGRKDLLEATEESWDQVFDTNLKGPFFLAQLAANRMRNDLDAGAIENGLIVNISSISAYATSTNRADYCMAKSAMQMMTWLYAERLAEEKIRVFEVRPGVIASDMTAPVKAKYDTLIADGLAPIRRWGQPEDVARVVAALTTDAFAFTTGETINVDGGFHIRRL